MTLLLDANFHVEYFLRLENLIKVQLLFVKWKHAIDKFPEGMKNPANKFAIASLNLGNQLISRLIATRIINLLDN